MMNESVTAEKLNSPMARGVDATPQTGFSNFSREWEDLFSN